MPSYSSLFTYAQIFNQLIPASPDSPGPIYKIQIDRNFFLIITVQLKKQLLTFQGSIYHSNGFQLKFASSCWKSIQSFQSLQKTGQIFFYDFNSSTVKFFCKITSMKMQHSNFSKIVKSKSLKIVEEAKSFLNNCYKLGLINFRTRFCFKQQLQESKLKKKLVSLLNPINDPGSDVQKYMSIENVKIQDAKKQQEDPIIRCQLIISENPLSLQKLPKNLQNGQKNIRNHLRLKDQAVINTGGFFRIQKLLCFIQKNYQNINQNFIYQKQFDSQTNISTLTGQIQQNERFDVDILVRKTLKDDKKHIKANRLKISKELAIVRQVKDRKHLINYFQTSNRQKNYKKLNKEAYPQVNFFNTLAICVQAPQKSSRMCQQVQIQLFKQEIFMQFHPHTLTDIILSRKKSLQESMDLCLQLIQSVVGLHESFVIHRDLKPQNILIDFSTKREQFNLKVIDFSESAIFTSKNQKYQRDTNEKAIIMQIFEMHDARLYGSTQPYSPPQCQKSRQKRTSCGINNFKIDSWSVGMIVPQIYSGKKFINFSKPYAEDIIKLASQSGLQVYHSRARKGGIMMVESFINFLGERNIIFNQGKRIDLKTCLNALSQVSKKINQWKRGMKNMMFEECQLEQSLSELSI